MIKGVIADVNKNKAVLLTDNGEFMTIRNKNYAIGQKIVYRKPSVNRYASIAACVALVIILGVTGTKMYYTSSSYIDIDINPSFRMELNSFDIVIKTVPLNDDAKKVLATEKISGDVKECIATVVDISENQGYINEDNTDVEIVVISKKEKLVESVNDISEAVKEKNLTVNVQKADYDDLKQAEELNISVSRLKIIEGYTEEYGGKIEDNATELALVSNDAIKALKGKKSNTTAELTPNKEPEIKATQTPEPEATKEPQYVAASPTKRPGWNPSIKQVDVVTPEPVVENTPEVVVKPVSTPAVLSTVKPTKEPELKPTEAPTPEVTKKPVVEPTVEPTKIPTPEPTVRPTATPIIEPTATPTIAPTVTPTIVPTVTTTIAPTVTPTIAPTVSPTIAPTTTPTISPSEKPDNPFWPWWDWIFGDILE